MFSNLKFKSKWRAAAGDDFVDEPAEVCALYRVVGINREDSLVEIESYLYIDERKLSSDLYKEISKRKNELKKIEVSLFFCSIAESFMKSHTNNGTQLFKNTYPEAMRMYYVSPIQAIRSITIPSGLFGSENSIYDEIHRLPYYIGNFGTLYGRICRQLGSSGLVTEW